MATLWVREYAAISNVPTSGLGVSDAAPVPVEPGSDQTVTFTTTTQSTAFAASTSYIAIIASAAFHYVVGTNPTATTGALKVPADTMVHIGVAAGQKIAAVLAA